MDDNSATLRDWRRFGTRQGFPRGGKQSGAGPLRIARTVVLFLPAARRGLSQFWAPCEAWSDENGTVPLETRTSCFLAGADGCRRRPITSSKISPLVATAWPEWIVRRPCQSVKRPPASSRIGKSGARSRHGHHGIDHQLGPPRGHHQVAVAVAPGAAHPGGRLEPIVNVAPADGVVGGHFAGDEQALGQGGRETLAGCGGRSPCTYHAPWPTAA